MSRAEFPKQVNDNFCAKLKNLVPQYTSILKDQFNKENVGVDLLQQQKVDNKRQLSAQLEKEHANILNLDKELNKIKIDNDDAQRKNDDLRTDIERFKVLLQEFDKEVLGTRDELTKLTATEQQQKNTIDQLKLERDNLIKNPKKGGCCS